MNDVELGSNVGSSVGYHGSDSGFELLGEERNRCENAPRRTYDQPRAESRLYATR